MSSPFDTCRQRIDRAEFHANALAKIWNGLDTNKTYTTRMECNDDGTGEIFISPTNTDWLSPFALEFGEMLYQLRAALDSCIYDCAVLQFGQNPPPKENSWSFPICPSYEEFKKAAKRIAPLSYEIRTFIESVQPYMGVKVTDGESEWNLSCTLLVLNDWARIDRHRRLHIVGIFPTDGGIDVILPIGMTLERMTTYTVGILKDESKIATFKIGNFRRHPDIHVNTNLIFEIAIDEAPRTLIATNSAKAMIIAVHGIMEQFETLLGIRAP